MKKTRWHYFVGDIHGCFDELLQLEQQIVRHAERNGVEPFIVSVGDLIDRGAKSAEVVRHFREGAEAGTHAAVVGNHESFMLSSLWHVSPWEESLGSLPLWLRPLEHRHQDGEGYARVLCLEDYCTFSKCLWLGQGGFETLESFGCDPYTTDWKIPAEELSFLLQLPLFWENEAFVVTHALASQEELAVIRDFVPRKEEEPFASWIERLFHYQECATQVLWRRDLPEEPPDDNRLHISGHSVVDKVQRRRKQHILQIDTGCVYGERLTAWCGESGDYFRVRQFSLSESFF